MSLLKQIELYCRVVEAGSFSAVAEETNSTQPTVSRQIAELENYLGARLLTRTTRSLSLTDEGRAFYTKAQHIVDAVHDAESAVGKRNQQVSGTLRLCAPVAFGRLHLMPRMKVFLDKHPQLKVELIMHDGLTDLAEEGIDVALRIGEMHDSSLVATKVGLTRRITVATPAYIEQHGLPEHPNDLCDHQCVVYTRLATRNKWHFLHDKKEIVVTVQGQFETNNSEGVREAVKSGLGIGVVPSWLLSDEIQKGELMLLLQKFEPIQLPMYAVYPSRKFVPLKVKALIEFLKHEFSLIPDLSIHSM